MVGGAISGYCAIGSVESAIAPTSVMTMLITPAKIGRSMKKCGKFMALRVAASSRHFSVCGFERRWSSSPRWHGRLLPAPAVTVIPGLQQLQPRRDNLLAVLQSAFHDPFAFEDGHRSRGCGARGCCPASRRRRISRPCCELITLSATSAARYGVAPATRTRTKKPGVMRLGFQFFRTTRARTVPVPGSSRLSTKSM